MAATGAAPSMETIAVLASAVPTVLTVKVIVGLLTMLPANPMLVMAITGALLALT